MSNKFEVSPSLMKSKAQYHHYIPRFLLRRWGTETEIKQPFVPTRFKSKKRQPPPKIHTVDVYSITEDILSIGATDLGKTYGVVDMYKDSAQPDDVYQVEKAFSRLENDAATVIRLLDNVRAKGTRRIELKRPQLNTLRKFLFILTYRNSVRSRQFIEGQFDEPTKLEVNKFMEKHGLVETRAVWLFNLRHMLQAEHWEIPGDERILNLDRMDYHLDMRYRQMGIYEIPDGRDDKREFLLTENGFGLWEGVSTPGLVMMGTLLTGKFDENYSVHLTRIYPIAPKLVIILRFLPVTMVHELRKRNISIPPMITGEHLPDSVYADLPQSRADVTYIPFPKQASIQWQQKPQQEWTSQDQKYYEDADLRQMLDGQIIYSRLGDKLAFTIHSLTNAQVERVNSLLLEHCRETITFGSATALLRSIVSYEMDTKLNHRADQKLRYTSLKRQVLELMYRTALGVSPVLKGSMESRDLSSGTKCSTTDSSLSKSTRRLPVAK